MEGYSHFQPFLKNGRKSTTVSVTVYKFIKRTTRKHLFYMEKIRKEIKSSLKAQEYESLPTTDWKEFRRIKCCLVLIENTYYCLNTYCIKFIEGSTNQVVLSVNRMPKMGVIREICRSLTEGGTDNSLHKCRHILSSFYKNLEISASVSK